MSSDAAKRKERQAGGTRRALRASGRNVRIHPHDEPSEMEYMFRADVIVVRDRDTEAVNRALHELGHDNWELQRNNPIPGVTTIPVPPGTDVDMLCAQIDA
jgi:hypothetical protein